jgi:DNA-binding LacI/PurR family transcriptional regulator
MDDVPLYRQIIEKLSAAILGGQYATGARLPTEAALGKTFGASRLTVNRALRELQLAGLIERRVGSGSFVSERRVPGLTFGLLIPELGQTEIFEPICQAMAQAQQPEPHALLWGKLLPDTDADTRADAVEDICRQLIARAVSGVFFAPLELTPNKDAVNRRVVELFERAKIPLVLLDRDIEAFPGRSRYDLVGIDNRRAGHIITRHLLEQHCQRLTFVGRPASAPTVDARIAGFHNAHAMAGLPCPPDRVWRIDPTDEAQVRRMLSDVSPDGIICANDLTAARLMKTCQDIAPDALEYLRVGGIDDVKYASLLPVPLTTIRQPCASMGAAAVATMVQRIREPHMPGREILLDFELVVRESCGAAGDSQAGARARVADLV